MKEKEKYDYEKLLKQLQIVWEYNDQRSSHKEFDRKMRKLKKGQFISQRVNTPAPEKLSALYIYYPTTKHYSCINVLVTKIDGIEHAYHFMVNSVGNQDPILLIVKSHAIDRYIERHGYNGSREDCISMFLINLVYGYCEADNITGEIQVAFDGGFLLGCCLNDKKIVVIKTYISRRQFYPNQKLEYEKINEGCIEALNINKNNPRFKPIMELSDYYKDKLK